MTDAPVRWGILGTGMIAAEFSGALERSSVATLSAVASRSLGRAEAFTEGRDGARAYGSYEELVSDPAIEAVYIATPQHRHRDDALLAIGHGKHVVVEKPLVLNSSDAETIAQELGDRPTLAIEGMWTLFNPLVSQLLGLVDSGSLGALRAFTANAGPIGVPRGHRALTAELGGSFLWECLVYPLAILTAVDSGFHEPASIAATSQRTADGTDFATAVLLSRDTSFAQFGGSFAADSSGAAPSAAQLQFENAWVELREIYSPAELTIGWNDGRVEHFTVDSAAAGFAYEIEGVSAAVRQRAPLDHRLLLAHTMQNIALLERIQGAAAVRP
ncbi:Gfo/Idh/MocA family protein [Subtercola frigoramans]|uniref:Dehydrogenase n=1 Tax=Subtercola frigoramans TaxID=120298 RepID=A0ABS2L140_9MICO|nr:Gfo/Idh/MocA family oxidoreductase [Subtercola frigoramans]MBM7470480.1 putative dehydrogenase [Subtercola frigoramans]